MKNGFPFNFIFTTVDIVQSTMENATSTQALSINLPMVGEVEVINSTTLEDTFGTSTASIIRTIESSLLWIGAVVVIISMIL
ncbi:MAG: hypothetical protein H7836_17795 [Magnetococcus sp. YQC-3]